MESSKSIIVSGAKPSGKLHLGNYLGMLQECIALQNTGAECFYFIADYHQLAEHFEPATFRQATREIAITYLALGLDPKKSTLFVQSDVPEHTELTWIFTTITPVSFLERMTQYKDKGIVQQQNVNGGLLLYPVLQAADILMYKSNRVPVGKDQVQHVELTRDIARFFNNKFGETFPMAEPILTSMQKVQSLADPAKKMSKSLGEKSYIAIFDDPDTIADKLQKAVTTPEGIENLLGMLKAFGGDGDAAKYASNSVGLKKDLTEAISAHFSEARRLRTELDKDHGEVDRILKEGAQKAREVAQKTMDEVRRKIGLK